MMEKRAIFGLFVLNILGAHCFSAQLDSDYSQEPQCRSQFDYEYKVVKKIVALENLCENLKIENSELREEIQDIRRKNEEGPKVAFFAKMERAASVSAKSTIIFDSVVTNIGFGYNIDDGIFAAPYDGVYQFSATMMTGFKGKVWAYFTLNGKKIAYIYGYADQGHDQGANTVILKLSKGDRVCVVNEYASTVYGGGYSSFSGNLL